MRLAPARCIASATLLIALVSCTRGPETEALRAELQSRLDASFEAGLFSVEGFERKGSAPFTDLERDISGIFVYYDAELRFERDYNLTAWRGLNVGTLAFVAGAKEAGVSGLRSEGNRAGDLLRVHGRLIFKRGAGEWEPIEMARAAPRIDPAKRGVEGSGPQAVLRQVRALVERTPAGAKETRDATVVRELGTALRRIDLGLAREAGQHTLGSGQRPGTYREFGKAFSAFATKAGIPFHAFSSEGSVQNGVLLQNGELDFALVQSDVAETLFLGWPEEGQISLPNLRSVASLWPEAVHVVTLEGTGIESFEQLEGRRIAIGRLGTGTRFTAMRIAQSSGIEGWRFVAAPERTIEASLAALESGRVDAVFLTEAVPSRPLQALAKRRPDVRIVALRPSLLNALAKEYFAYYPLTVPARTYPGQTTAFQTVGLAATLVTHGGVPDEAVTQVLDLLLNGADELAQSYFRAGFISRETVRLGIAVPLHPAAERFYDETQEPSASRLRADS